MIWRVRRNRPWPISIVAYVFLLAAGPILVGISVTITTYLMTLSAGMAALPVEFLDALLAHRTQVSPDGFWMKLPLEVAREAYPYEDYTLASSTVPVRVPENDLFHGIPG